MGGERGGGRHWVGSVHRDGDRVFVGKTGDGGELVLVGTGIVAKEYPDDGATRVCRASWWIRTPTQPRSTGMAPYRHGSRSLWTRPVAPAFRCVSGQRRTPRPRCSRRWIACRGCPCPQAP